jgi:hypothetical protein
LHLSPTATSAGEIALTIKDTPLPGSYLVIGHVTGDHVATKALLEPGLTPEYAWRAESDRAPERKTVATLVGVACKKRIRGSSLTGRVAA